VLEALLPALDDCAVIDVSGGLELDPAVPLYLLGHPVSGRRIAVPRGIVTGIVTALAPLAADAGLERVTVTTLESASGAGRAGLVELQEQTLHLLQALDGEAGDVTVFPQPLAFDCLPLVGEFAADDESSEERRLRHVLRRALARPGLIVETTRVRVPVFMGAMATVHARFEKPIEVERIGELWRGEPSIRLLSDPELPTPRDAQAHDRVSIGRVRVDPAGAALGFVVALDPLRRGAALGAVEVLEQLLGR
jgi:aspartate-semialdehyde dehydrogenase